MGIFNKASLIERLAKDMRWLVSEREGDYHVIRPDDGTPIRFISIRCRDDRPFIKLWVVFPVRFPIAAITPALTLGLLKRNQELYFGRWCVSVTGSCELGLVLHYTVLKTGLTAETFLPICREMVGESDALHNELRDQLGSLKGAIRPPEQPQVRQHATGTGLAVNGGRDIVWLGE